MTQSDPIAKDPREFGSFQMGLQEAARYERVIGASITRVWENVYDWEHLPHLHSSSFSDLELEAEADWGWRARAALPGGTLENGLTVELVTDKPHHRYVSRTVAGANKGMEIWTDLKEVSPHETAISVGFFVPPVDAGDLEAIGEIMIGLYTTLWDEDEDMMVERQRVLDEKLGRIRAERVELGSVSDCFARAPFTVHVEGLPVRIFSESDKIKAFVAVCPHMLRPLDDIEIVDGTVTCPWHGYQFNVAGGACRNKPEFNLFSKAEVKVGGDQAVLVLSKN